METNNKKIKIFIDQCTWTWIIYSYYQELFDSGVNTLKLFEKCSHQFFYDLEILLSEYIIIRMCCLTDPATSGPQNNPTENLTINHLLEKILWLPEVQSQLYPEIDRLNEIVRPLRKARNKIIAHADLKTSFNNTLLGAMPKEDYEEFFNILEKAVDIMHQHLIGDPHSIKVAMADEPAHQLIKKLKNIKD
ncbi:MAG: hypothetical protein OEZ51_14325 [Nitrospinota bacterium]|nr:hypothetical protein [Nitrospinota bacterium]